MAVAGPYAPITPFSPQIYTRGTVSIPEKASQTYKKGAPLVYNGGYLEEAGSAPSTIAYIAAEDGHNGGSDGTYNALAYRAVAGDQWEFSCEDALTVADNGAVYGLVKDATSGFWYLDEADTADQVVILRPSGVLSQVSGDTKARAIGEFQTANIAGA
jgi:hypothetical protein